VQLGLSEAQLAERRTRLHAGDAPALMEGNLRKPYRRLKFGEEEDLYPSLPWFVQKSLTPEQLEFAAALGNYTEPFNLAYTMQRTGREIEYFSANELMRTVWCELTGRDDLFHATELVVSKRYPWMACNLDGMTTTPEGHRSVIDAKHLSRFYEAELLKYTPYGVWQATCAGTDWWGIAPIAGTKWEPPIFQEVDPIYQATLIARGRKCREYIEAGIEPPEFVEPVLAPKPTPKLRSVIVPTDNEDVFEALCRRDNWLSEARDHIRAIVNTDAAAKVNAIHREGMKDLVPPDVGKVVFGRYSGKRDKAGLLRQNVSKLEDE